MTKREKELWTQVVRCVNLHHPVGVNDEELSSYGQGARDALRHFLNTLRGEWARVIGEVPPKGNWDTCRDCGAATLNLGHGGLCSGCLGG